jgi:KDO2-lipid IV(A) lauroyltransferase
LKSYLIYLISRFAMTSVRLLPRPTAIRALNVLASLTYRLDALHRHIARINLTIAFPELSTREHDEIARKSFQNTARNLLEVSRMHRLTPENIGELVQYDPQLGLNNFERARARQKGILYLTGHFSAWELLPTAHALYGHPLSFVTRPLDNAPLETYLHRIRELAGNKVIYKRDSARPILEELKTGGSVGILMDQNTSLQEGIFADLFGLSAATSTSIALLALRTEASVLPGYLTPRPDGRYTIKFLVPVDLIRTGDTNRDVALNTREFNRILEDIIREQPETWLWGHRRWSYQPDATPDLYRLSLDDLRNFLKRRRSKEPTAESRR